MTITRTSLALLTGLFALSTPSDGHAYRLFRKANNGDSCSPGQKWGTKKTVKVRYLYDSFQHHMALNGIDVADLSYWQNYAAMLQDIEAVVDEYNSVKGIDLELELVDSGILGDTDLEPSDEYNKHSIIIGFTSDYATSSSTAPAWMKAAADDDCTFSRVHLYFAKYFNNAAQTVRTWDFGIPDVHGIDYWEEGKVWGSDLSFRAILLHEMGHALGLRHPTNKYAVMNHGTKTWMTGEDHAHTELLPDDINGLRALYGNTDAGNSDISLSNTTYLPASEYEDDDAAHQEKNCLVSSRADNWTAIGNAGYCATRLTVGSSYQSVGNQICPGEQVQVRYTINNKRDEQITTYEQLWFSTDSSLDIFTDRLSSTTRQTNVAANKSKLMSRIFTAPETLAPGEYHVISYVSPYHPTSGTSLIGSEESIFNNYIPLRGTIEVLDASSPRCMISAY